MNFKSLWTVAVFFMFLLLSSTAIASPTLSKNSRGNDVLILQKKLYLIGYNITELDGVFGNETEKAVTAFQKDQKISATGVVTNVTWRALKKAKEKKGRVLPEVKIIPVENNPAVNNGNDSGNALYGKTFISKSQGAALVATAKSFIGVPYVFGGTNPSGFDCSGLLQYVFKMNGLTIPRLADEQYYLGCSAEIKQLLPGDLVFFTTYTSGVSHCGIYVGNGKFLHASSSRGVTISNLSDEYWKTRFVGAKKLVSD
ncbi:MAG: C40 family peptidase [Selenomonadaceae bacterium]|nr:C40 family peptidase [Selenomonadaceae bacterium]